MLKCSPPVTLSGSGGEEFRGFLVQARTVADGSPVGVFTDNGDDQKRSSCTPPEVSIMVVGKYIHVYCSIVVFFHSQLLLTQTTI